MNNNEKNFDDKIPLKVAGQLSEDLKTLFKPRLPVPPEVDRAVIDQAHRRLLHRRPHRLFRWAASVAAVAAVIIFALLLDLTTKGPGLTRSYLDQAAAPADIDRNGRVDILDAFKLARHIQSTDRTDTKWDINGDGLVNRSDVDSVAFTAVRLNKGVL